MAIIPIESEKYREEQKRMNIKKALSDAAKSIKPKKAMPKPKLNWAQTLKKKIVKRLKANKTTKATRQITSELKKQGLSDKEIAKLQDKNNGYSVSY